jgi:hypothetical protein
MSLFIFRGVAAHFRDKDHRRDFFNLRKAVIFMAEKKLAFIEEELPLP